jgi:hypothetical protein
MSVGLNRLDEILNYGSNTNNKFKNLLFSWLNDNENNCYLNEGLLKIKENEIKKEIIDELVIKMINKIFILEIENLELFIEYIDLSKIIIPETNRTIQSYYVILRKKEYNLINNNDYKNENFINCIVKYNLYEIISNIKYKIVDVDVLNMYKKNNLIDENEIYEKFNDFIENVNYNSPNINLFEYYKCILWYMENFSNINIEKLVIPERLVNIGYEYPELRFVDYLYRDIKYYKLQKSIK